MRRRCGQGRAWCFGVMSKAAAVVDLFYALLILLLRRFVAFLLHVTICFSGGVEVVLAFCCALQWDAAALDSVAMRPDTLGLYIALYTLHYYLIYT